MLSHNESTFTCVLVFNDVLHVGGVGGFINLVDVCVPDVCVLGPKQQETRVKK